MFFLYCLSILANRLISFRYWQGRLVGAASPKENWWGARSSLNSKGLERTVNTSYKLEPYIPRVWGFWAYFFCILLLFCFFDTCWFKFGSGTPPSVSGTINSTGFRPSFVQFRQILVIFDQFLDVNLNFLTSLRPKMRVLRAYDCWSIGPRVSELKVRACDGVLTVSLFNEFRENTLPSL